MQATYNFEIVSGQTWAVDFTYKVANGSPVDVSMYMPRMQVRSFDNKLLLDANTSQIYFTNTAAGELSLVISPEVTRTFQDNLHQRTKLKYAIEFFNSVDVEPFLTGDLVVIPNVIQDV